MSFESLMFCSNCKAKITTHHEKHCVHWGPVVPSECKGLIDAVMLDLLAKREKKEDT